VRLVFLGDISAVASNKAPIIDKALRDKIASAELVIANCESPVVARPLKQPGTMFGTRHAMTRQFLSETLSAAGILREKLILSLANNHALDQGAEGFDETRHELAGLGIRTVGVAAEGVVQRVAAGPVTVGFAAFTEWRNASAEDFAGRVLTSDAFDRVGSTALQRTEADLLCAIPHWDLEFRHFPQPATRKTARRLAEKGFGLVVGGHAHVVQPAERIGDTLVAYGLGDFVGTAWSRCRLSLRLGAILVVDVVAGELASGQHRGKVASYEIVPFLRQREGGRERLVPLTALSGTLGETVDARWRAIFYRN
jgi:poly-gamma-glutamate synthesis protein (capsule biosynthesis protein)